MRARRISGRNWNDPVRIALVGDCPSELVGDGPPALGSSQEHHAAVRGDPAALEGGAHLFPRNRWQVERQRNILIHQRLPPLIAALPRQRNHAAYSCFGLLPADCQRPRDYPMRRRELIFLLGGAMVAPRALRAQQKAMPVIGFLGSTSPGELEPWLPAFREGLSETGYI